MIIWYSKSKWSGTMVGDKYHINKSLGMVISETQTNANFSFFQISQQSYLQHRVFLREKQHHCSSNGSKLAKLLTIKKKWYDFKQQYRTDQFILKMVSYFSLKILWKTKNIINSTEKHFLSRNFAYTFKIVYPMWLWSTILKILKIIVK